MIQLLLADNQAIFRAGTARVLQAEPDMRIVGQCDRLDQALDSMAEVHDAILVVAESLQPDWNRLFAATEAARCRVILLAERSDDPNAALLRRVDAMLTRHTSASAFLHCVRTVAAGDRCVGVLPPPDALDDVGTRMCEVLTTRELQIVGFIVRGFKNRQIAEELGTKEQVVKNYLRSVYDKTGSSDRLELALFTLHHRVLADAAEQAAEALQHPG